jgi:O-antigen chain-terminating methyltransferase
MIENNNPDIDVDEIMTKIRAEIAGRNQEGAIKTLQDKPGKLPFTSSYDWQQYQSILRAAENNADIVNPELPMNRYSRRVRWLARLAGRVVLYLSRFVTIRQTNYNQLVLQALHSFARILHEHDNKIAEVYQKIADVSQMLHKHERDIADLNRILHEHEEKVALVNQVETSIQHLRTDTVLLERQVGTFLEEARKRLPEQLDDQQLKAFANAKTQQLDALYVNLTDRFRGSREDIKERLKVYLPIVQDNNLGSSESPVLDLGCGRGEWLDILRENKLSAQGVDLNPLLVESCRENELEVFESDIFEHLRTVPDQTLGAVTAFHLVEHLPFDDLIKLLDETLRVLKSGGVAIYETPNPENVHVGSCNFYHDPTHRNPIPSQLLKFMVESRGFCRVNIMLLHPFDEKSKLSDDDSEVVQRFNEYFYGPQDYAVVGFKV